MIAQDVLEAMDGVVLLLDRDLKIRAIGEKNWRGFWCSNSSLEPPQVLGTCILNGFSQGVVRDTYRELFEDVFHKRRDVVEFTYRCDAPDKERRMRLSVRRLTADDGEQYLLYQSTILSIKQRPPMPIFGLRFDQPLKKSDLIRICAVCAAVAWPVGADTANEWITPEQFYARGGAEATQLTHGFCPGCYEKLMAEED